ncbi:hypothetical protein A2U01_0029012, partial [Trifolium medium]|nr:hypothetical protein [Trifolium medium]
MAASGCLGTAVPNSPTVVSGSAE